MRPAASSVARILHGSCKQDGICHTPAKDLFVKIVSQRLGRRPQAIHMSLKERNGAISAAHGFDQQRGKHIPCRFGLP